MTLTLTPKFDSPTPIVAEAVSPDRLSRLKPREIERLPVLVGNQQVPLAELFDITGAAADLRLELVGDMSSVHHLGTAMQHGEIRIEGNIGRHLGSRMQGGRIEVSGNAGDWLGAELQGGTIRVEGNAGDRAGAAYVGSSRGMNGGTILIEGSAGSEVGVRMRRGLMAIGGSVGSAFGANMLAGTLVAHGNCGKHPGAGMRRGTILLLAEQHPDLLPTFSYCYAGQPTVVNLLSRELQRLGFLSERDFFASQFDIYRGDNLELGKGEVLVRRA